MGSGTAGLATADALRSEGWEGDVVLVGAEPHEPYDRPPLSKQLLAGRWTTDRIVLRTRAALAADGVELLSGRRAIGVDTTDRTLHLDEGDDLRYDALVVATGLDARRLPFGHDLAGVHVLRTLDDALGLRAESSTARRVVVIGAGFLGCEVAATVRQAGAQVAIVDPLDLPLRNVLGPRLGTLVAEVHAGHGVDLHLGRGLASYLSDRGRVTGVVLDDGSELPADLVVVAIGATPAVQWLRGSAVPLAGPLPQDGAGGVRCDAAGRAVEAVWAVGDVAAWWSPQEGRHVRLEHRLTANQHAQVVARAITGGQPRALALVPYFWSEQYDLHLQSYGTPAGTDEVHVVEGSLARRRFLAVYLRGGRVSAVVGAGLPKALRAWVPAVAEHRLAEHRLAEQALAPDGEADGAPLRA
ncbi:FAD/NAD(P)-binding oxidoreductase [Kineococcus siccus]|uniref:NAD(P)/FAD-dependent oxidoreductase n=1 Tax=Kineococcus siccus TaxID=2696567 RepID=UPI0030B7F9CF